MKGQQPEFHWGEGMKYALEGIKILFILNGAAAVSILTFVGNRESGTDELIYSMVLFSGGAATGPIALFFAYLTQLKYGNAEMSARNRGYSWAVGFHWVTYVVVFTGIALFLLGVACAGFGLKQV